MRVFTSPSETGAVTLSLPQDVQAEAFDFPEEFLSQAGLGRFLRPRCDAALLSASGRADSCRQAPGYYLRRGRNLLGGDGRVAKFRATGIPVCETQAGKGALNFDHPSSWRGRRYRHSRREPSWHANGFVLGIGTRYSDFTSASKTAF